MEVFSIRFFICNLIIAIVTGILLAVKKMLHSLLSSRMQYSLWFILLGLLSVPFLPIRTVGIWQIFVWIKALNNPAAKNPVSPLQTMSDQKHINSAGWINDFSISVSEGTPSVIGLLLLAIWLLGILAMLVLVAKSGIRLYHIKQSALPLQNQEVKNLYSSCLEEMKLNRSVPIYSTAFLKSPVMTGLFVPRIYLPIHLISAYNAADMRYMLLHELQHYKYKDAFASYLMILAGIVYWFNPLVWYALREMRNDREVACDTSVLHMLDEKDYEAYGHTLIDFAEKISLNLYPFAAGIGGSMKQMKRRIQNIASYEPQSFSRKLKGCMVFGIIGIMLFCTAPTLSMYASEDERYRWTETEGTVSYVDFSTYFEGYNGSFVLYDPDQAAWTIYNKDYATMRVDPNSTYKIYAALLGLENGIITPEQSHMAWNQENYPIEAWNGDQDLYSAMRDSVNWYFQAIEEQAGSQAVKAFMEKIGYDNKISPIEQVELLKKFNSNAFLLAQEHIQTVKDSLRLYSSPEGSLYGKTGTGRVDGHDINGWFIGYVERMGHIYYFAANIQGKSAANGISASKIALSLLSDLHIWH